MKKLITLLFLLPLITVAQHHDTTRYRPYMDVLQQQGKNPVAFVKAAMETHPLLIFDDGLHTAADPFVFYEQLLKDTSINKRLNYVFLEVIPSNKQKDLDAYLNAAREDSTLLFPAFQDDYGTGFPYQTYFDLFHALYQVNKTLPAGKKLKALAVGFPVYWEGIKDRIDLAVFRNALLDYDFHMYQTIRNAMHRFQQDERGIFLTNTRHAYKSVRDRKGTLFWNCNTYFTQWDPGMTYSIRIHNAALFIESVKTITPGTSVSAAGTEKFNYHFDRMSDGLWDYALGKFNKFPVAIDINDNAFGNDPYVGNLMLNVQAGTKMSDAYDAVIFLKPLEQMQQTPIINYIYTTGFMKELSRRYQILFTADEIKQQMEEAKVNNIAELLLKLNPYQAQTTLPQVKQLGSTEKWKTN